MADIESGRAAFTAGAWRAAYSDLTAVDQASPLDPSDLELLARAAYMLGNDDEYVAGLERAHAGYLAAGDPARAVRCAFWIGHNLLFRGEMPTAMGWFERAHRVLDSLPDDCAERGWLLIPALLQQMVGGDYESAYQTAVQAAEIGVRFGDADLTWLARDDQGHALLAMGRVQEALRLVNETLVSTNAGELSPVVTGIVYCNTIAFCQEAYQLRHAREWTAALTRWCDRQPEMIAHNGLCLMHRAEVMQIGGDWADSLAEAQRGVERFTRGVLNEIACGKAYYRQGEIHRLRGEAAEAEGAYRNASRCNCDPQPGLALLRLAQDNVESAAATIRRAVAERTAPLERARMLPAYIEIALATGEHERADAACRELEEIAAAHAAEWLSALAAEARGTLLLAQDDPEAALVPLRNSWRLWLELDAPYDAARLRILLGLACRAVGDADTASLEFDAARATFERLGAAPDLARLAAVTSTTTVAAGHGLTDRELDVLRLLKAGDSNRAIASALSISEHTVARHLQNIFVKLGVSTRTAASAFAIEHNLV